VDISEFEFGKAVQPPPCWASPLDPTKTRQFFCIIDQQADYLQDLISNLLDLSRLEAGTLPIVPHPGLRVRSGASP
jgi:signal transduction histidine kinase